MLKSIKIRCPECKEVIAVTEEHSNTVICCPCCQQQLRIPSFQKHESTCNEQQPAASEKKGFLDLFVWICMTLLSILAIDGLPMCFVLCFFRTPLVSVLIFWVVLLTFVFIIYCLHRKNGDKDFLIRMYIITAIFCIWGCCIDFGLNAKKENTSVVVQVNRSPSRPDPVKQSQPKPIARQDPVVKTETAVKKSIKAKSPELQFLGISVNEFEYNIKNHLVNRGFFTSNKYLYGRFWILPQSSLAEIRLDSGKIIIRFETNREEINRIRSDLIPLEIKTVLGDVPEIRVLLNQFHKHLQNSNVMIKQYFNVLQWKYGKAKMMNDNHGIIKLEDGLIELVQKPYVFLYQYAFNDCCYVIFYNRKAARKRLEELEAAEKEINKRFNDI